MHVIDGALLTTTGRMPLILIENDNARVGGRDATLGPAQSTPRHPARYVEPLNASSGTWKGQINPT